MYNKIYVYKKKKNNNKYKSMILKNVCFEIKTH